MRLSIAARPIATPPLTWHAVLRCGETMMKVTRARIYLVESGGLRPVILRLETDEGLVGLGEAAIAYGAGAAAAMLKELGERWVLGQDPFRIEQIWSQMYDH